jgi:DNA-binding transcriptional ArsR family regulator
MDRRNKGKIMSATFILKPINPRKLKVDAIRLEILNELGKQNTLTKQEYEKCTSTWTHKPKFVVEQHLRTDYAAGLVTTDDEVFWYVDKGTEIRWALMSSDWKSKTRRGYIGSSGGSGRVVVAGKRYMIRHHIDPRPGIKARDFSGMIYRKRVGQFGTAMRQAVKRGANKSWG